jgi:serine/threonine-protein kinase
MDSDSFIGRVIDRRFTVIAPLGRGGMGTVYRAKQSPLGRLVALKLLAGLTDPERIEEFHRRFFLEASTAAKLRHPNTITVFDYGSEEIDGEDVLFISMELVEGKTLTRALKSGPFHPRRAMNVMLQVAASLREAHESGIVHRDLKPGNVMLVERTEGDEHERDFVKVLDFGLAKTFEGADSAIRLTRAGTFLGSPRYVSPEQIEGRPVDPRADIYSFGCVSYRMLCGHVPFDGEGAIDIMMKHLKEEPPLLPDEVRAEAPPMLVDLVMECLGKEERDRPQDMAEVITRLKLAKAQAGGADGFWQLDDDREDTDRDEAKRAPPAEPSDPPYIWEDDDDEPSMTDPSGPPEMSRVPDVTDPDGDPLQTTADRPSARVEASEDTSHDETSLDGSEVSTERSQAETATDDDDEFDHDEDTPRTGQEAVIRPRPTTVDTPLDEHRPAMVEADLHRYRRRGRNRRAALLIALLVALVVGGLYATGNLELVEREVKALYDPGSVPRREAELRLSSEPSGALVTDAITGRKLGRTPLKIRWRIGVDARPRQLRFEQGEAAKEVRIEAPSREDPGVVERMVLLPSDPAD